MRIVEAIRLLVERGSIEPGLAARCMEELMKGEATHAQAAAFLIALRIRGEDPAIIAAMSEVMRRFATPIRVGPMKGRLIDTCGTGGDAVKTINVSTASGLVAAAAGCRVAKHGNRSFTGYCGSADFLEEVGVRIDLEPEVVSRCIESLGFGFIYAPRYHQSMRNVMPVRREIGIRTVFNLLGPLTNPAPVNAQVLGVFSREFVERMAEAVRILGREEAAIIHGDGGIDEVSIFSETTMIWIKDGEARRVILSPESFGLEKARVEEIIVESRNMCIRRTLEALTGALGRSHPLTRLLLANSSLSLMIAGLADDPAGGAEMAWRVIESGKPIELLRRLVKETDGDQDKFESWMRVVE
ncbi:MAG: anthranilate phosphoribosyltransferase [Thaumarchaeota archaeon]|jgi:anthranilate phosphoribosyltransferase|nr:anthranilate phosphoribosyltransferase [Candidatus Wolframiiraptor allenii]